jgi:phage shock protein PspC (stress-responsive transcriptional regulator)
MASKRLFRKSMDGRIAGVCAGLAEYFDTDVVLVRLAWVLFSIVPGGLIGGVIAYAVAWILIPNSEEPSVQKPDARRLMRSTTDRKLGGVCGGIAEYFDLDPTVVRVAWAVLTVVPGGIVLGVIGYLVAWVIMPANLMPTVTAPAT